MGVGIGGVGIGGIVGDIGVIPGMGLGNGMGTGTGSNGGNGAGIGIGNGIGAIILGGASGSPVVIGGNAITGIEGAVGVTVKERGADMKVAKGRVAKGVANIADAMKGDRIVNWFTCLNKGSVGNSGDNNDGNARGNNDGNVGGNSGGNHGNLIDAI